MEMLNMSARRKQNKIVQKTLKHAICFFGRGLHTGKEISMTVRAGETGTGIYFLRNDVPDGKGLIPARWYNINSATMGVSITNKHGISVSCVSHILAALHAFGIDNAVIELDGQEVPAMDGSAEPFASMLRRTETIELPARRRAIYVHQTVVIGHDDQFAILSPNSDARFTVETSHPHPAMGQQKFSLPLTEDLFQNEISPARNFYLAKHIEYLHEKGLLYGLSDKNSILLEGEHIVNEDDLRFNNEYVRHLILDCMGDLSLAGAPIIGHFYGYNPDHSLIHSLLCKLFSDTQSWFYVDMDDIKDIYRLKFSNDLH